MKLRIPGVFAISVFVMLVYSLFSATVQAQFSQQAKLVGTDAIGSPNYSPQQGLSVALSADGNTAIVGGPADNNQIGAAWVFTRWGAAWSQQAKLVGTGVLNPQFGAAQGFSVSLSADGNTALVGGFNDNFGVGAAWVFTRSGEAWSQQAELVGTDFTNPVSLSLPGDGNTAIVGGLSAEAAWVFTRSGEAWSEQQKLVGTGVLSPPPGAGQGSSVALSADANTVLVGGPEDNNGIGAAWVYTQPGVCRDARV